MRIRALFVLTVALTVLLATGCARPVAGTPADAEAPPTPADRRVAVYSAVLRQYLTSDDASLFRGAVYVLDQAVPAAADPTAGNGAGEPIPVEVQDAVAAALTDLGPVTFVPTQDEVIQTVDGCPQVRGQGILITLAPVGAGDRVEIGVGGFVACLAGTWLTYVVERVGGEWVVRGTTGPRAIA